MFIFCLHAENSNSQNISVTIQENDARLENVLNEIEKQTDYLFIYNKYVNVNRKVSIDLNKSSLEEALKNLFDGTNVKYSFDGSYILLTQKMMRQTRLYYRTHSKRILFQVRLQIITAKQL